MIRTEESNSDGRLDWRNVPAEEAFTSAYKAVKSRIEQFVQNSSIYDLYRNGGKSVFMEGHTFLNGTDQAIDIILPNGCVAHLLPHEYQDGNLYIREFQGDGCSSPFDGHNMIPISEFADRPYYHESLNLVIKPAWIPLEDNGASFFRWDMNKSNDYLIKRMNETVDVTTLKMMVYDPLEKLRDKAVYVYMGQNVIGVDVVNERPARIDNFTEPKLVCSRSHVPIASILEGQPTTDTFTEKLFEVELTELVEKGSMIYADGGFMGIAHTPTECIELVNYHKKSREKLFTEAEVQERIKRVIDSAGVSTGKYTKDIEDLTERHRVEKEKHKVETQSLKINIDDLKNQLSKVRALNEKYETVIEEERKRKDDDISNKTREAKRREAEEKTKQAEMATEREKTKSWWSFFEKAIPAVASLATLVVTLFIKTKGF